MAKTFLRKMGMYEEVDNAFRIAEWSAFMTFSSDTNVENYASF